KEKEQQQKQEEEKSAAAKAEEDKKSEQDKADEKQQAQMQSQQVPPNSDVIKTDPRLQKLEQSGAKEDELLRAQLYLQAQQQEAPQASENEW
ncbi:transporter, partial [Aliivibrio sp. SR45-2]|nr:transporter [Aliivibrio sp. SR45-2]